MILRALSKNWNLTLLNCKLFGNGLTWFPTKIGPTIPSQPCLRFFLKPRLAKMSELDHKTAEALGRETCEPLKCVWSFAPTLGLASFRFVPTCYDDVNWFHWSKEVEIFLITSQIANPIYQYWPYPPSQTILKTLSFIFCQSVVATSSPWARVVATSPPVFCRLCLGKLKLEFRILSLNSAFGSGIKIWVEGVGCGGGVGFWRWQCHSICI